MKIEDISHELEPFCYSENSEKARNTSDESISEIGIEKINSLKKLIKEIEGLIESREKLSKEISQEVEKIKAEINNFLLSDTNFDSDDGKERSGLRQKKVEISELQLTERLNCWKDIAVLKKELRDRQKELEDKEERLKTFNKILEEGQ